MTPAGILALTLRAEAGERPVRALEALAALVVNRARLAAEGAAGCARYAPGAEPGRDWAALIPRVCRAPFLFTCWSVRSPRRAMLLTVAQSAALPVPQADPVLDACRRIAARAAAGTLPDPTEGATHWHDGAVLPGWALGQVATAEIGGLVFYRFGGG